MTVFDPACTLCPRLAAFLAAGREQYPSITARPVAPFGDATPRLLLVGLAPGFHGANATGRPFTGDYAGILLYETLHEFGWSTAPVSRAADDGLRADRLPHHEFGQVRAAGNKPTAGEIANCNRYLAAELAALADGTRAARARRHRARRGTCGAGAPRSRSTASRTAPSTLCRAACGSSIRIIAAATTRNTAPDAGDVPRRRRRAPRHSPAAAH